jgi:deoxyhypusine synthase
MSISKFIDENYKHFNAGALKRAAIAYKQHIESGGKMFITLSGAMSTGELGISLAEMIRQKKVCAISCTGANLEEDVFNLVANQHYKIIPNYRDLSPQDEQNLYDSGHNRVTDTTIPEEKAIDLIRKECIALWKKATKEGKSYLPHEYFYRLVLDKTFQKKFTIDIKNSWILAAAEQNLPLFVPGWEDSTIGNMAVASKIKGEVSLGVFKSGLDYMESLVGWYKKAQKEGSIGFFQIGGGIAGDFPICVVPLIVQDLEEDVGKWGYFCQITDAQESYGGYSGALPNEKITWGKLEVKTPKFVINSDAIIVAPLIFNYVLGK